jgi:hypothetical protein
MLLHIIWQILFDVSEELTAPIILELVMIFFTHVMAPQSSDFFFRQPLADIDFNMPAPEYFLNKKISCAIHKHYSSPFMKPKGSAVIHD